MLKETSEFEIPCSDIYPPIFYGGFDSLLTTKAMYLEEAEI
jgi:hypothetical protein